MDTPAGPYGNPSVPHRLTILGVYSHPVAGMSRFIIKRETRRCLLGLHLLGFFVLLV